MVLSKFILSAAFTSVAAYDSTWSFGHVMESAIKMPYDNYMAVWKARSSLNQKMNEAFAAIDRDADAKYVKMLTMQLSALEKYLVKKYRVALQNAEVDVPQLTRRGLSDPQHRIDKNWTTYLLALSNKFNAIADKVTFVHDNDHGMGFCEHDKDPRHCAKCQEDKKAVAEGWKKYLARRRERQWVRKQLKESFASETETTGPHKERWFRFMEKQCQSTEWKGAQKEIVEDIKSWARVDYCSM